MYFMSMASSLIAELNKRLQGIGKKEINDKQLKDENRGGTGDKPRVSLVQVTRARKLQRDAEVEEFMKSVIIHKKMIELSIKWFMSCEL